MARTVPERLRNIAAELGTLELWIEETEADGSGSSAELVRRYRRELRAMASGLEPAEPDELEEPSE